MFFNQGAIKKQFNISIYVLTLCVALLGCKKTDNRPNGFSGAVTNTEINQWIADSLKRYYYWADALPANISSDQEPLAFFSAIKNNADRFSYLQLPGGSSSIAATTRSKYGFDYLVITEPVSGKAVGLITLVMNTSPAQAVGLRRGQYFSSINNTPVTTSNAAALYSQILSANTVKLGMATLDGTGVKNGASVNVTAGATLEQTALQKTFNTGGKKIGYLFFTAFNSAERADYLQVFSAYKADGITDLILDLRYNAGGDVSAAAAMAALIANPNPAATFVEFRGNKNGGVRKVSFATEATAAGGPAFSQIQQNALGLPRLYVLTTAATASAAELLINNLTPYLNVVHVGETTRGKDEAAIVITDKRPAKRVNWELSPIVYKLFNAQGLGGYSNGIAPAYLLNQINTLPLKAFGDATDPMTAYLINLITTGQGTTGLTTNAVVTKSKGPIFNSALEYNVPLKEF